MLRFKKSLNVSARSTWVNPFGQMKVFCSSASFVLFLIVVIWIPIPKAGMMPAALPFLGFCMAAVFYLHIVSLGADELYKSRFWLLIWLAFSVCICIHVWLVPYLSGVNRLIGHDSLFDDAINHSIVSGMPKLQVWYYFSIMWVAAWRVSLMSERQIKALLLLVMLVSSFQAFYGVGHFLTSSISVLGLWDKLYYTKDVTGTFVNRNHFSGMLAICWPLVLSGLIAVKPLIFSSRSELFRVGLAGMYSLLIVIALITSHSRMGVVAAFFGFTVWGVLYIRCNKNKGVMARRWLLWCAGLLLILFAIWFGVADILGRYSQLGDANGRLIIWSSILDLPLRVLVVGVGPGGFEDVYQLVKPSWKGLRTVYAHNDYLEFLVEFGFVLGGFLVLIFSLWLWRATPRGDFILRAGALGSVAAMALHSVVDFSLQIPGAALFFWIAIGVLMNEGLDSTKGVLNEDLTKDGSVKIVRRRNGNQKGRKKALTVKQRWMAYLRPQD